MQKVLQDILTGSARWSKPTHDTLCGTSGVPGNVCVLRNTRISSLALVKRTVVESVRNLMAAGTRTTEDM